MVWPLVEERVAGLRQLAWMGEPVSQYGDVLVEDGDGGIDAAARRLGLHQVGALARPRAPAQGSRRCRVKPLLVELQALPVQRLEAPYLDLAGAADFAAYEQRYSPRSRRNRRRLARRFEERGTMAIERAKGGKRARELAELAIAMKRTWLKERGLVSPALADPRMSRFFADVAEGLERPAGCQLSALTTDGEAAAIEINLVCKDRTVMHVIVFNLKYEKAGAGVLLLEDTIAKSFGNGCKTFDLLAPADAYKLDWADGVAGVADWALALTLKGWRVRAHLSRLRAPRGQVDACRAADADPALRRRPLRELSRAAQLTPSFFCRLDDDVVYWNSSFLSGIDVLVAPAAPSAPPRGSPTG